jgi:hypothetical protein
MDQTALATDEAVLLAHALVARVAAHAGVRILFIKGPTAVALGARPDRPSSDVDVLVDPAAFEDLCAGLTACGWELRTPIGLLRHAADLAFDHSAHLIHAAWPCDLDVHYLFPGFLAPPAEVFEALWERRTEVEVAGRAVPTADLLGQLLVVGLHGLRNPEAALSRADLDHVAARLRELGPEEREALSALAEQTGSDESADALLVPAGAASRRATRVSSDRLVDWRMRQSGLGSAWLAELRRAPWPDKPATLRRALLPPREHLLSSYAAQDASASTVAMAHVRRWGRGLRAIPRAVTLVLRRGRDLHAPRRRR